VKVPEPELVGVPEITPVEELIESPAGRLGAVYVTLPTKLEAVNPAVEVIEVPAVPLIDKDEGLIEGVGGGPIVKGIRADCCRLKSCNVATHRL
jgi:hypothetical protein